MRTLKAIVGWACLAALVAFIFMNTEAVEVKFFNLTLNAALGVFILAAAALGGIGATAFKGLWSWTRPSDRKRTTSGLTRVLDVLKLSIRWLSIGVLLLFVFMNLQSVNVALPAVSLHAPIGYVLLVAAVVGALGRSALGTVLSWIRPQRKPKPEGQREAKAPEAKAPEAKAPEAKAPEAEVCVAESPAAREATPKPAQDPASGPDIPVHGVGNTDPGRKRGANQDVFLVDNEHRLYLVCDGMGGHAAGEVASALASSTAAQALRDGIDQPGAKPTVAGVQELIVRAVQTASRAVLDAATNKPEWANMGCALTIVQFVEPRTAVMGHVGDTRLYQVHAGRVTQLSRDHSLVAELARGGVSDPELAKGPLAHALSRCVGHDPEVAVDTLVVHTAPGDLLVLCSDGLGDYISQPSDLAALLDRPLAELPDRLIQYANQAGGSDNVTVVVIRID